MSAEIHCSPTATPPAVPCAAVVERIEHLAPTLDCGDDLIGVGVPLVKRTHGAASQELGPFPARARDHELQGIRQ
jgi:hypothetical protein